MFAHARDQPICILQLNSSLVAVSDRYTYRLYKNREEDELLPIKVVVNPEYRSDRYCQFVFVVRKKDEKIKEDKIFIKETSNGENDEPHELNYELLQDAEIVDVCYRNDFYYVLDSKNNVH